MASIVNEESSTASTYPVSFVDVAGAIGGGIRWLGRTTTFAAFTALGLVLAAWARRRSR